MHEKQIIFGILLCTLLLFSINTYAQGSDSAAVQQALQTDTSIAQLSDTGNYGDTFYTAGLVTMIFFFLIGFCVLTLLGIALGTLVLLVVLGFGLAGIISTSVIYGLYKRSLEKTFRTFLILAFGFGGMLCCAILFPLFNKIVHWTQFDTALLAGVMTGLWTGLLAGYFVFRILKSLTRRYVQRIKAE